MRLKQLRKEKGLTQEELGKVFNLAESSISLYEKGKREIGYKTLKKFANYFGVTIDYLLENEEKPNTATIISQGGNMQNVKLSESDIKKMIEVATEADSKTQLTEEEISALKDFAQMLIKKK